MILVFVLWTLMIVSLDCAVSLTPLTGSPPLWWSCHFDTMCKWCGLVYWKHGGKLSLAEVKMRSANMQTVYDDFYFAVFHTCNIAQVITKWLDWWVELGFICISIVVPKLLTFFCIKSMRTYYSSRTEYHYTSNTVQYPVPLYSTSSWNYWENAVLVQ